MHLQLFGLAGHTSSTVLAAVIHQLATAYLGLPPISSRSQDFRPCQLEESTTHAQDSSSSSPSSCHSSQQQSSGEPVHQSSKNKSANNSKSQQTTKTTAILPRVITNTAIGNANRRPASWTNRKSQVPHLHCSDLFNTISRLV